MFSLINLIFLALHDGGANCVLSFFCARVRNGCGWVDNSGFLSYFDALFFLSFKREC